MCLSAWISVFPCVRTLHASDWMRARPRCWTSPGSESWLCIYSFFYRTFLSELTAFLSAVQKHHEKRWCQFLIKLCVVFAPEHLLSLLSCLQINLTHMLPNFSFLDVSRVIALCRAQITDFRDVWRSHRHCTVFIYYN